jgi:geranylgeranyl transferase type-2 subunit beta
MSLVSGPGRGGVATDTNNNQLFTQKHVDYIKKLDTVRPRPSLL